MITAATTITATIVSTVPRTAARPAKLTSVLVGSLASRANGASTVRNVAANASASPVITRNKMRYGTVATARSSKGRER